MTKRKAWRVLRAALIVSAAVWAFYVIAINVFLSTSLFDRVVNADPIMLDVHYAKGWSIFPGTIHARNLSIRSSDSNVMWILRLDEVEFDVSFLGLAQRRFDVGRARGRGITFRVQQKLDAAPDSVDEVKHLAPIQGFPAFAVRPAGPPHPERWDDAQYQLVTVSLEDVIAEDVREIWIDEGRFTGNARITGRFYLKPIRAVDVGPAHVEVRSGRVDFGDRLVEDVAGTADVTIDRFDPRAVPGRTILRHVSAFTELQAKLVDPLIVGRRIAICIDHGRIVDGTRVEASAPRLHLAKENLIGDVAVDAVASVTTDGIVGTGMAKDLRVVSADAREVFRIPRIHLQADGHALDLAGEPLGDLHGTIEIPDAHLVDATVLNRFVSADTPLVVENGAADAHGRLELWNAEKRAAGHGSLHGRDLAVRLAKMHTTGAFDVDVSFGAYRWEAREADDVRAKVVINDAGLASATTMMVRTKRLELDLHSKRVDVADPLRALDASFSMPESTIVDLGLLGAYLPKRDMKLVEGRTTFGLDGRVTLEDHLAKGELHARSKALGLVLGKLGVSTRVDARARVHDWRWERGDLVLDEATVAASNVKLGDDEASIREVAVQLRSPRFAFSDPLARVDIDVKVEGGSVRDPTVIDSFLPDAPSYGFVAENGTFAARGHLSVENHVGRGHASAEARRMGVRAGQIRTRGDLTAALDIQRWDLESSRMDLGMSSFVVEDVRGRLKRDDDVTARRIALRGKAVDLDMAHPSLRGVDLQLIVEDAAMPDARALSALLPAESAFRIESGRARATADVTLSSSERTGKGSIDIDVDGGAIAVHRTQLGGSFAFHGNVKGFDLDASTIDVSGSRFSMRDVAVKNAAAEIQRWRGDLVFEDATLRIGPEPRLEAALGISADNARPILGVLLRKAVPGFVVDLIDMPGLVGGAHLRFAPQLLQVSDLNLRGGDVVVRGTYGVKNDDGSGAFVLEKSGASFGIRLDDEGAHPRFFGLDKWLENQERSVERKAKQ